LFHAGFADAEHGLAMTLEHAVFATDDGGAHWMPVQAPQRLLPFIRVGDGERRIVFWRANGDGSDQFAVEPGARLRPIPAPPWSPPDQRRSQRDREQVNVAMAQAGAQYRRGVHRADGTIWRLEGREVVVYAPGGSPLRRARFDDLPSTSEELCDLEAWGTAVLVHCTVGYRDPLYRLRALDAPLEPLRRVDQGMERNHLLSSDGVHAVRARGWDSPPYFYFRQGDDRPWRRRPMPMPFDRAYAMEGTRVLARIAPPAALPSLAWIDLDGEGPPRVELVPTEGVVTNVTLDPRGLLAVVTERQDGRRVGLGPDTSALTWHALPPGAEYVRFADASRGLAWGRSAAAVFRTLDGGAHWEPVPVPIDGHPDTAALLGWGWRPPCDETLCHAGAVRVAGWGTLRPDTQPALATRLTLLPPPPRAEIDARRMTRITD
jgi:hypothetical protein